LQLDRLPYVQRVSSDDFNRLVWRHLQHTPANSRQIAAFLQSPLYGYQRAEDSAILNLGSSQQEAIILLKEEHQQWVIDDIVLRAEGRSAEEVRLKEHLREEVITLGNAHSPRLAPRNRVEPAYDPGAAGDTDRFATPEANMSPFVDVQTPNGTSPQAYRRIRR